MFVYVVSMDGLSVRSLKNAESFSNSDLSRYFSSKDATRGTPLLLSMKCGRINGAGEGPELGEREEGDDADEG